MYMPIVYFDLVQISPKHCKWSSVVILRPIRSCLRHGAVLSPYFFNACLYSVLPRINPSCFLSLTNLLYITYADDLLLIRRTKSSLIKSTQLVSKSFEEIGLKLNPKKCEYLVFNAQYQSSDLARGSFSVKLVSSNWWLDFSICSSLSAFRSCGLNDIKSKLKIGYVKIVPNRGRFSWKALSRLYST